MEILLYIVAGAGVGFLVGLTGVGGGSLMTPLLILFGFPAHTAIGTDLLYAAITKSGGVVTHARSGTVNWKLAATLGAGSIPASIITTQVLAHYFPHPEAYKHLLTTSLGLMLIVTAAVLLFKDRLLRASSGATVMSDERRAGVTVFMGVILGVFVTLSSVGAGAIGTALLMLLYPALSSSRVVGTDLAHAVPLTFIAGLGHMQLGNIDYYLLGSLLIGSLPAIHFGTALAKRMPSAVLRPALASMLLIIGVKYAFF
ncbi:MULTISPECIES: sulfite exporter TauE/SafE family protein [unclassified Hahella]|uniref:sulfite exporter TauE/SafE family protein n=1 Tax=unclassified Hahella TaxID=2624107 RepID=UPI001C1EC67F|nr:MULTISPECIES: sulfite exporter TauE/SafE family protein [unclassified Hahella]MBU6950538.1 sulfite exporter TauE/SafE family protein [Hahella sp. HN01]MDG9667922.1 sulfite exporter TauE/SafE family protein [Hahella sp. CR1]